MTQEERQEEQGQYKERLFQTMEDMGLVDNVRVQIRQKLLDKLKQAPKPNDVKPDQVLVKRICSSLIIDYMSLNSHNYSLSVFQPECGFSNAVFPSDQVFDILKVSKGNGSVLEGLVENSLPKRIRQPVVSTAQQTDDKNSVENIQRRLESIEASYKNHPSSVESLKLMEGREQREVKMRNQLSKRYKEDLEKELKRVREFEVMNIRLEERERYNISLKDYKDELDQQYKERLGKLRDREEEVMKRVTDKIKQLETHSFDQRQKVLKDMEYIRLKERELQLFKGSLEAREKLLEKELRN